MENNFDDITEILDNWLHAHLNQSRNITTGSGDRVQVNKSLLRLEHWLIKWREDKGLNERVNAALVSEAMLSAPLDTSNARAFSQQDFQYNFLHFLALHPDKASKLHLIIDRFVEHYSAEFSLADLLITDTGATRCKTNIRFALNSLRELALVESRNLKGKRSLRPTLPGITILLNCHFQAEELKQQLGLLFKDPASLKHQDPKRLLSGSVFEPTLYASLQMFRKDAHIYLVLDQLAQNSIAPASRELLYQMMQEYIAFTQECIEITSEGLRFTDAFKERSKAFTTRIWEQTEQNEPLLETLFTHYQKMAGKGSARR